MKTMQLDNSVILRVKEDQVSKKVSEGWKFVPKSLWKEQVRDVGKPTEDKPTKSKTNKMSKSAKRHLRKANK